MEEKKSKKTKFDLTGAYAYVCVCVWIAKIFQKKQKNDNKNIAYDVILVFSSANGVYLLSKFNTTNTNACKTLT